MQGTLEPGSLFAGEYRVVRPIGAGGMGAVYEVEQQSTRKRRALKVLANRFGRDEKARTRFIREATVGASISSEHVVDVIGAGVDESTGLPWLAMELLGGVDLKRLLDRRGPLGPAHARTVFSQLGHGLAAAHRSGVVHRDLKPENIFIARSQRAGASFTIKILDFGIAKITRESVISTDTATIGSPMWMAPEQINADPLSARTDVWALGLLAFWALTHRVYWTAAYGARVTVQALFAEQLFAPLVPPSARASEYRCRGSLPPEFDAWFSNCVARDVGSRFADAGAATRALLSVLDGVAKADPEGPTPLLPEGEDRAEMRRSGGIPVATASDADSLEMAGTTADVLGHVPGGPHVTAPSDVAIGLQSTHLEGGLQNQPTQQPPPFPPSEPGSARGPVATTKLAALIALPAAAILGVGITVGATQWGEPDSDPAPPADTAEVDAPAADSGAPPELPPVDEGRTGVVELDSLPAPGATAFLGWTADGELFAVRASYGSKLPVRDAPANYLELIHLADGATGAVAESYAVDRVAAEALPAGDALARAAAVAHASQAWVERRVQLLLRPPDARRAPARAGELRMQLLDVPARSRVRIDPKRGGFDLTWWRFDGDGADVPRMEILWHAGGERSTVLDERVVVGARQSTQRESTLRHELRVFWSPDETRCVIVLDGNTDHRWFFRELPR